MAGGGVRSNIVAQLVAATGVQELHSSASRMVVSSMVLQQTPVVSFSASTDMTWSEADADEIKRMVDLIHQQQQPDD